MPLGGKHDHLKSVNQVSGFVSLIETQGLPAPLGRGGGYGRVWARLNKVSSDALWHLKVNIAAHRRIAGNRWAAVHLK